MEQVRDDVLDGFISNESARDDYGVVLDEESGEIDVAATEARRGGMAGATGMFHRRGYFDGLEEAEAAE